MSTDDFRSEARALLNRLLDEAATNEQRDMMLEIYSEEFTKLHREYAHGLLNDVISDVRTRLDARLSPDPIRQTIATVQTTVQDLWKNVSTIASSIPEYKSSFIHSDASCRNISEKPLYLQCGGLC